MDVEEIDAAFEKLANSLLVAGEDPEIVGRVMLYCKPSAFWRRAPIWGRSSRASTAGSTTYVRWRSLPRGRYQPAR